MRDQNKTGVVTVAVLADTLDGNVLTGERGSDRGEHPGLVRHVQVDVIARHGGAHRQDGQIGIGGLARTAASGQPVACHRHQVTQHRGRGRRTTRPATVEHQLPGRLRLNEHGVERLPDPGQRMGTGNHRRVHPHTHTRCIG